jgi:hypothetical protein
MPENVGLRNWWLGFWYPTHSNARSSVRQQYRSFLIAFCCLSIFIESFNGLYQCYQPDFPYVHIFPVYYPIRAVFYLQLGGLGQLVLALRLELIIATSKRAQSLLWHGSLLLFILIVPLSSYLTYISALESDRRSWFTDTGSMLTLAIQSVFPVFGLVVTIKSLRIAFSKQNVVIQHAESVISPVKPLARGRRLASSLFSSFAKLNRSDPTIKERFVSTNGLGSVGSNAVFSDTRSPSSTSQKQPLDSTPSSTQMQISLDRTFKILTGIFLFNWVVYVVFQVFGSAKLTAFLRFRITGLAAVPTIFIEMLFRELVKHQVTKVKSHYVNKFESTNQSTMKGSAVTGGSELSSMSHEPTASLN